MGKSNTERIAKEIYENIQKYPYSTYKHKMDIWGWDKCRPPTKKRYMSIALHQQKEVIRARLDERRMFYDLLGNAEGWNSRQDRRIADLTNQLKELEKGENITSNTDE